MQRTMINHPKLNVHFRTGSEGPRHDPYSYEEWTIETPENTVQIHQGLGDWIKCNGREYPETARGSRGDLDNFLTEKVGFTLEQIRRIHRNLKSRCPKGGQHEEEWISGYPGEDLLFCHKCEKFVDSTFNESAII